MTLRLTETRDDAPAYLFFLGDLENVPQDVLCRQVLGILSEPIGRHAANAASAERREKERTQLIVHYSPSSPVVRAFRESPLFSQHYFKLFHLDCSAASPELLVGAILSDYHGKELVYVASRHNSERARARELESVMCRIRSDVRSTFGLIH